MTRMVEGARPMVTLSPAPVVGVPTQRDPSFRRQTNPSRDWPRVVHTLLPEKSEMSGEKRMVTQLFRAFAFGSSFSFSFGGSGGMSAGSMQVPALQRSFGSQGFCSSQASASAPNFFLG